MKKVEIVTNETKEKVEINDEDELQNLVDENIVFVIKKGERQIYYLEEKTSGHFQLYNLSHLPDSEKTFRELNDEFDIVVLDFDEIYSMR